ncbi:MAG: amidohydrolase family protein [Anaerolineales bacterium]|nr:amidohydrolase family protein [Anaerolineales bacterium]
MPELPIYNCHIHTFTAEHVPDGFSAWGPLLRHRPVVRALGWLLRRVDPWDSRDLVERYARLVGLSHFGSQQEVLEHIRRQYPASARFVVLPMDLAYMGAGRPPVDIAEQQAELLRLAARFPETVIPFCAVDPRRPDALPLARRWIAAGARGVKIYPCLGYYPHDPVLLRLYELLEERGLPVLAHCSPGGIRHKRLSLAAAAEFAHPRHYEAILRRFPNLRICLAHFGGGEEWERHLRGETEPAGGERAWVKWIADLIRSGDYPSLYTDIAYTLFMPGVDRRPFDYFDYLKVLLAHPRLRERVLFGSDYYMVTLERMTEKEAGLALRSRLGEALFFQIAHHNPRRYLGEAEDQAASAAASGARASAWRKKTQVSATASP